MVTKAPKKEAFCPVEITLSVIAGRWKIIIIYYLMNGPKRFNELQRLLGRITHRTLTQQLRELEQSGLVLRKDYKEIPPRVEYSVSPLGRTLQPVLEALHVWGEKHPDVSKSLY